MASLLASPATLAGPRTAAFAKDHLPHLPSRLAARSPSLRLRPFPRPVAAQGGKAGEGGPLSSSTSPLPGSSSSSSSSNRRLSTVAQATQQQKSSGSAAAVEDSKIDFGDFFKGDLPKKFLMLLGLLALSRVGIYIPLWGVDISAFQEQLGEGSFLATLDTLSGGGIGRLGLFSLGIVPYINAQIVFQLLGTLYPKIADLQKKEGEAGRKKAQQYMKYMAVAFGALQAIGQVAYLQQYAYDPSVAWAFSAAIGQVAYLQQYAYDPSVAWAVSAVSGLTLGSVTVILLGDKITHLKLGNGMFVGLTCAHLLLRRQVAYLKQYAYDPSVTWAVSAVSGLTLGSVAVILLGDKITHLMLGNGTSLLIFTNIVSYLPFYALFSPVFFSLFLQAIGQVAYLQHGSSYCRCLGSHSGL
ncbi:unnamed protein product [Closterium sp. NIES-54]